MPEAIRSNTKIKQKNKIFIDILGAYLFLALSIVAPSTLYAIDDRLLVYSYIKKLEGKVVPEQTANQLIRSFASVGFSSKNILEEPKRNLSVFPFINYSSNLNGGNPKGALQLGNATYTSNSLLEKRSGLLAGLGANASLRSYTGYGKYIDTQGSLAISKSLESDDYILFTLVNACSKNHLKNWWFIDVCAHTQNEKKEISTFEDQTVNLSFAKIFDDDVGSFHLIRGGISRNSENNIDQNQHFFALQSIWPNGYSTSIQLTFGEDVPNQLSLKNKVDAEVRLPQFKIDNLSLQLSYEQKDGGFLLGFPRDDQQSAISLAFSLNENIGISVGYSNVDSSIDYYDQSSPFISINFKQISF